MGAVRREQEDPAEILQFLLGVSFLHLNHSTPNEDDEKPNWYSIIQVVGNDQVKDAAKMQVPQNYS